MMDLTATVSQTALDFADLCQVAAGQFGVSDVATQADAVCDCVSKFPQSSFGENDLVVIVSALLLLGVLFFRTISTPLPKSIQSRRRNTVIAVLNTIRTRFAEAQLSLASIASEQRLSVEYLSRAIAAETRHSFPVHVNSVRLLRALCLLRDPAVRIKETCDRVGYESIGELDRQMRRRFRMSPREFRGLLMRAPRRGGISVLDWNDTIFDQRRPDTHARERTPFLDSP